MSAAWILTSTVPLLALKGTTTLSAVSDQPSAPQQNRPVTIAGTPPMRTCKVCAPAHRLLTPPEPDVTAAGFWSRSPAPKLLPWTISVLLGGPAVALRLLIVGCV